LYGMEVKIPFTVGCLVMSAFSVVILDRCVFNLNKQRGGPGV